MGCTAGDIVTGFGGTITGKCSYLTGCDQVLLAMKVNERGELKSSWFDVTRVKRVGRDRVRVDGSAVDPGGLQDHPADTRAPTA